jgi:hypothetical protein
MVLIVLFSFLGAVLARCSSYGFSGVFTPWGEWRALVPTVDNHWDQPQFVEMNLPQNSGNFTLYHYIGMDENVKLFEIVSCFPGSSFFLAYS